MLLSYGLKSEATDKGVTKIFVNSSFGKQLTKSLIENIEKL